MYATKPLSLFKSRPEAASQPPPEGRNSGYLVVKGPDDDDGSDGETCCWGTCGGTRVRDLPFPQNRVLTLRYTERHGKNSRTYTEAAVFVPVAGQPLSSNRYYAVVASGADKGLVRVCSREEADVTTFCFCRCVDDVEPRPFDPADDVYQQMEIVQHRRGRFTARAVAAGGIPPFLYRKKYWRVYASRPRKFRLDVDEAPGLLLDAAAALRSRHQLAEPSPSPAAVTTTAAAVGRWYCPFFLVREGGVAAHEQMDRSAFYEVALEQRWEPARGDAVVHARDRSKLLASKKALIGGSVEAEQVAGSNNSRHGDGDGDGGFQWFRAATSGQRVGVCRSVWERMLWEQSRGGWVDEEEKDAAGSVDDGDGAAVVLVERFVVRRMDGSVAVAFDFVHHDQVRIRAEQVP